MLLFYDKLEQFCKYQNGFGFRYELGSDLGECYTGSQTDGDFSVKSLRNLLEFNRTPVDFNPMVWSRGTPLKVRSFIWKVRLNKIPSKVALKARGVCVGLEECSSCFGNKETADHVFLSCPFASAVWEKIVGWCA